jgi:predicted nuclease of predicted toxin-antitoxin system
MLPEIWEVWLDSQLSPIIAKWMAEFTGLTVKSSYSLQLNPLTDSDIYHKAKISGNVILISKDADFPELISRLGAPPKLIVIKKGNCDNRELWEFIKPNILRSLRLLTTMDIDIVELE